MSFLLRPATAADLPAINDLYNHYVRHSTATYQLEPTTPAERDAWFAAHDSPGRSPPRYPVSVAATGTGEVIGWGALGPFHPRAGFRFTAEDSVYVHPAHHRQGIGRALLQQLLAAAAAAGHRAVVAVISADQEASLRLHAAAGFVEAGRLRGVGHKFGRWLDVVYLQWTNRDPRGG
jgi:phosphinothricin acetyltransferase